MDLYGRKVIAGKRSIGNLLLTALCPLGNTMYVWGGGWNEADDGAGIESVSIGVSPRWKEFADEQDKDYDFERTRYQIHDGLDCSGYIGWLVYNVFETENEKAGYVMSSTGMAEEFADRGWGMYTPAEQVKDWKPGDIMSMPGHVWMVLGMCEDGSVLLFHASPPGVILCGTETKQGDKSQAVCLAKNYMKKYHPDWYERFPQCSRPISYLERSGRMRWKEDILSDPERLREMDAPKVLAWLFGEK